MPVSLTSQSASSSISCKRALHRVGRLQRVDVGEAGHPRDLLVEPRIVLHRARAEREQAEVDRVILAAEAGIVAHRLGLGEAGQADRRGCARGRRGALAPLGAARRNRRRVVSLVRSRRSAAPRASARGCRSRCRSRRPLGLGPGRPSFAVHAHASASFERVGEAPRHPPRCTVSVTATTRPCSSASAPDRAGRATRRRARRARRARAPPAAPRPAGAG